jgi:hypothetical protein
MLVSPASWEWDDLNWDYGAEPEAVIVVFARLHT